MCLYNLIKHALMKDYCPTTHMNIHIYLLIVINEQLSWLLFSDRFSYLFSKGRVKTKKNSTFSCVEVI